MAFYAGLDVGSTTVKVVCLDAEAHVVFAVYRRHKSDVKNTVEGVLQELLDQVGNVPIRMAVTGSGGMFLEDYLHIPFVQEVVAETKAIRKILPHTEVIIELGGEDSKITYLSGNVEQRMNSICAGGTGAFIDQMANLLDTDAAGLNALAREYEKIYPIASRCGVFAKTDVQALLNQGASHADIAMSVFQSVVNQTISNLACGRPIRGNITFLGGPLHFMDQLRNRFIETLGADDNTFTTPEDGQLFVARGAALLALEEADVQDLQQIVDRFGSDTSYVTEERKTMEPLFTSEAEYEAFRAAHETNKEVYATLEDYHGPMYLGIDSGSTTAKMVLLGEDDQILYTHYSNNRGKPLEHIMDHLNEIYAKKPDDAFIACSGITGYGEDFIRAALQVDTGEVETIAHYTAAHYFDPDVDFILDIGGQDMKAMHISDGIIDSIQLNEACSSGCGSFLSTFAASVGMSVQEFQQAALLAKEPVDLGSRCTVFMNSKVKQAQKEGSEVGDIAAGLCYSVIKNAIQKVIKVRDPKTLGKNLVVQGGTFYGDAILRAFEKITGRTAIRPAIAGLMGAMGMALIAKERSQGKSTIKTEEELRDFTYTQKAARCGRCTNNCALTINIFSDGNRFISGNRCERGAGIKREKTDLPNLYRYKYDRLFHYYSPIAADQAQYPTIGIPRVLNLYENYPFWHTFFTRLGFPVQLSDASSREMYDKGLASISSETVCYPAKLVHGHIEDLIQKGVKAIFYPSVFYETKQFDKAKNQINCPVVIGFPEVIKNNVSAIDENGVTFFHPFLSFANEKVLMRRLTEVFATFTIDGRTYRIPKGAIQAAVAAAWAEQQNFHDDVKREGQLALEWIEKNDGRGIVLAGRPYHVDNEVNHGIPELINGMGLAVLSEDAIAMNIPDVDEELRVLDQWVYHSRLYRAAEYVAKTDALELIQLNSFGCGLDAVTTDQVQEILESKGKIYTVLKIDEVSNLGAVKIRIRSLIQALSDADGHAIRRMHKNASYRPAKAVYTKKDKAEQMTILVPDMAPDHFEILSRALANEGYRFEFLQKVDQDVINAGLKYVNNDSCYPSITALGQMFEALESGKYDPDHTALLMTQTGGACRASNYVGYIRKGLKDMGYPQVPVIALSAQGIETNEGLTIGPRLVNKAIYAILAGDLLMRCANATRPYEKVPGQTDNVKAHWKARFGAFVVKPNRLAFRKLVNECVAAFDAIPRDDVVRPRVGIVGEILVKYLPAANNHLQALLEAEGAEVVVPDLADFFVYCMRNGKHKAALLGTNAAKGFLTGTVGISVLEFYRKPIREALRRSKHFSEPLHAVELERDAMEVVSLGHQYGEGWLLAGEMIELIHAKAPNIVCIQPFGCLPNHITGKGVMKAVRDLYPEANLIAIDYDPGASEVNQINRVKLMMSTAWEAVGGPEREVKRASQETPAVRRPLPTSTTPHETVTEERDAQRTKG
ncbi:MAG: acyl-CoA dehydratase activase-related protein [Peptoniphilaceae bacterium]|nr:acyl-CoA dehydratase activase-related protein [Peptoniphilaceae bacterium]